MLKINNFQMKESITCEIISGVLRDPLGNGLLVRNFNLPEDLHVVIVDIFGPYHTR